MRVDAAFAHIYSAISEGSTHGIYTNFIEASQLVWRLPVIVEGRTRRAFAVTDSVKSGRESVSRIQN
jgi:hypothetical protein